jgi:hypothetical protein
MLDTALPDAVATEIEPTMEDVEPDATETAEG